MNRYIRNTSDLEVLFFVELGRHQVSWFIVGYTRNNASDKLSTMLAYSVEGRDDI